VASGYRRLKRWSHVRALETDPENGAYLDSMGWIYFTMGDYEKALEYIKRAHALNMESVEVATHLGDVYEKLGMKEKAIEVWQEALKLDDDNHELLIRLKRKVE
jgi:tetratricopeptide (TPR) repeat protein